MVRSLTAVKLSIPDVLHNPDVLLCACTPTSRGQAAGRWSTGVGSWYTFS